MSGRLARAQGESLLLPGRERQPGFVPLTDFEEVDWDYRRTSHSTRRHPLEAMRASLLRHNLPDARTVATMKNGAKIRYAGLVICRQRPGTAGGVVFMTLEDETGFVNAVIWENVFQRYPVLAKTVSFLGISGRLSKPRMAWCTSWRKNFWEPRTGAQANRLRAAGIFIEAVKIPPRRHEGHEGLGQLRIPTSCYFVSVVVKIGFRYATALVSPFSTLALRRG